MSVASSQRFKRGRPCPICGGHDADPRGRERRCHGYLSSDGSFAHCARPEQAGTLTAGKDELFAHRIVGPCKCGSEHAPRADEGDRGDRRDRRREIVAVYSYRFEDGALAYDVVRFDPKSFSQRRPDGKWKVDGIRRVPYRLPELLAAGEGVVFVVEGEKDVESMAKLGLIATCNPAGAGKWMHLDFATVQRAFKDRDVVILPDADEAGRAHAPDVAKRLAGIAASVRIVELFPDRSNGEDVSDFVAAGGTVEKLREIVDAAGEPPKPAVHYQRCPDLVDAILSRASEGFIDHTLGGEQLYKLRLGGVAILTGAPGTGKTSLSVGLAIEHARERGPVVYVSLEMDADELAARAIGMQCDASWEDVLCGRVDRETMSGALALPRFVVLDGDHASLAELESAVATLRAEYREFPILVVVDYLQIVPGDDRDMRTRVAATAQRVRVLAKRLRVVMLAISQPSRAAGRALSAGDLVGADSMTAMAESAEIERAAYITLALGAAGTEREDGSRVIDMSVGKGRMGGGDQVRPLSFVGRSGRMRIAGESRAATEVKAERQAKRNDQRATAATHAIADLLSRAPRALYVTEIRSELGGERGVVSAAVRQLRDEGRVVRVRARKKGGHWPVIGSQRAVELELHTVPEGVDD